MLRERPDRDARDEQRASSEGHDEDDGSPGRRQQSLERDPDERTDPAARLVDPIGSVAELVGAAGHLEQPEHRQRHHRPADHQLERAGGASLSQERDARRHEHDRHGVAAEAEQPAGKRLDAATERTGEVHVDGQTEQDRQADQSEPDELVLPAADRIAELGGGLIAPRSGTLRRRHVTDVARQPSPSPSWSSSSPVAPLVELLAGDVEPFLGVDFLAVDDDFFLEAPHVDMTSYTVPTRHHPRP